jgi:heat shock protein HslJ
MRATGMWTATFVVATLAWPTTGRGQERVATWLDETRPASWNTPGLTIPAAPNMEPVEPRCREMARPPQLEEDTRLRAQNWDLVGAFEGGWEMLAIGGTAGYDGMCRPRQYQHFVFVHGLFAGTLAPQPMESRTDGALSRVFLQGKNRLTAEYLRYASTDPLCCPSKTTSVVFEVAGDRPVVIPVSASTAQSASSSSATASLEGPYWKAIELAGKPTPAQEPQREAHLQFQAGGRVSGSDGCNRLTGTYQRSGDRLTFGQMAGTQMACVDATDIEGPFRDTLKNVARFTINADRLEFFDASGTRLAVFSATTQPRGRPSKIERLRARFEDRNPRQALFNGMTYLDDSRVTAGSSI